MYPRRHALLMCFLLLLLPISSLHAQELVPVEKDNTIYLYREGMPIDVIDLEGYVQTGEVEPLVSCTFLPPRIVPGPAPDPYPTIEFMEKRYEQLGVSSEECDGIWFINGNLWHPRKWALVMWKIRIPDADQRLASEFEEDLTLTLWVDWNCDGEWSRNEQMLCDNINLHEYFPTLHPEMRICYLTMFRVPRASMFEESSGGRIRLISKKVWARGVITYNDPDTSPDGECVFGECEDYNINYFEILKTGKKRS